METPLAAFAETLRTDRLLLRRYRPADADWYAAMARRNQAHLARYESRNAAFGVADAGAARQVLQWFDELWLGQSGYFLGAFLADPAEFAAQVYVGVADPALPRFTLGFFADCGHEGRGLVTEAVRAVTTYLFAAQRAHKVDLHCDETNLRCQRVAERCGFAREAHLREHQRTPEGAVSGTYCYARFRTPGT